MAVGVLQLQTLGSGSRGLVIGALVPTGALLLAAAWWMGRRFAVRSAEAARAQEQLATTLLREVAEREAEVADRETEAAQQLRVADQMKNTFLAAASHDLANPVMVVRGFAHTLGRRWEALPAEDRVRMLAHIERASERLARLLMGLLDVQRLTSGTIQAERERTELTALARRIVSEQEPGEHPVAVEGEDVTANVDPGQVERIVENLVRNAIKYTPEGTPIRVSFDRAPDGVILTDDDEGPGVPDELKEPIFEMFRRGEVGSQSGMGVGLHLVSQFAKLHGGRAWVEDRPGGGARFRALLRNEQEAST